MTRTDRPDVLITIAGPELPYTNDQLLAALLAVERRFETLRGAGSPPAALRLIEAELEAKAATDPAAAVIAANRLRARVEADVRDDGAELVKLGKEPWNRVLRTQLFYIGVIMHLPKLPFAQDFDSD
jgi:hypothetical protein